MGNIIGHSPQGNFLRQVEEEWGTLMFFADFRGRGERQEVTPAAKRTRASASNASSDEEDTLVHACPSTHHDTSR